MPSSKKGNKRSNAKNVNNSARVNRPKAQQRKANAASIKRKAAPRKQKGAERSGKQGSGSASAKAAESAGRVIALEELRKVGELLGNQAFLGHVATEVGPESADILRSLAKSHKTDEELAAQMSMKVNDIRRMLNVMNSYSIVRYDVNKDSKGWLIFTWRIDGEKLQEYIVGMSKTAQVNTPSLPANCNDFFICKKCYTTDKVVLPFDSAFEASFTCGCGKSLSMLNREQTIELFKDAATVPS